MLPFPLWLCVKLILILVFQFLSPFPPTLSNGKPPSQLFVLSREGKLDVLKELCLEHKDGDYIHTALKSKDKFGQTPMLSSISASENRNEILKFLLNLILERSSDTALQEVRAILEMEF